MISTSARPLLIRHHDRYGTILSRWRGESNRFLLAADLIVERTLRQRDCSIIVCGEWSYATGMCVQDLLTGEEEHLDPDPGLFMDDLVPVGHGWKAHWPFSAHVRFAMASDEFKAEWSWCRQASGYLCGWGIMKVILEKRLRSQTHMRASARFSLRFTWEAA